MSSCFSKNFFRIFRHNKIKKCYFEIKNCFVKLGMLCEVYNTNEKCYSKYNEDLVVKFEMLKCRVMVKNKIDRFFTDLRLMLDKDQINSYN